LEQDRSERKGSQDPQLTRMMQLMEQLVDRMDSLEDRVDFTERMLERQQAQSLLTQAPLRQEPERR
jgi:hypothetical protein